jgi:ketosteroid isomerase-like protein
MLIACSRRAITTARSWSISVLEGNSDAHRNRDEGEQRARSCLFRALARGHGQPLRAVGRDADWTIVGSSPLSKTYPDRQAFLDAVILPFNARMATPLKPLVHSIYADGDMVIAFFDASATTRDNQPYHNTYTWYFRMLGSKVVSATAFFDTRDFDEFWDRVTPS